MRATLTIIRGDSRTFEGLELGGLPDPDGLYDAEQVTFTAGSFSTDLDGGVTIEDDTHITLAIAAGDLAGSTAPRVTYPFDVEVRFPDGSVVTGLRGRFVVLADVTRD